MINIGSKYKMFTVQEFSHKNSQYVKYYNCLCDCGNTRVLSISNLKQKYPISCGCFKVKRTIETHRKHGQYKSSEYTSWTKAKSRCYNKKDPKYYLYGARGITMSDSWLNSFEEFIRDMGKKPSKTHTIDRKDSSKGYNKENCIWATPLEQSSHIAHNKFIKYKGMTKHLSEWARYTGINLSTIRNRLRAGKPLEVVFCETIKR